MRWNSERGCACIKKGPKKVTSEFEDDDTPKEPSSRRGCNEKTPRKEIAERTVEETCTTGPFSSTCSCPQPSSTSNEGKEAWNEGPLPSQCSCIKPPPTRDTAQCKAEEIRTNGLIKCCCVYMTPTRDPTQYKVEETRTHELIKCCCVKMTPPTRDPQQYKVEESRTNGSLSVKCCCVKQSLVRSPPRNQEPMQTKCSGEKESSTKAPVQCKCLDDSEALKAKLASTKEELVRAHDELLYERQRSLKCDVWKERVEVFTKLVKDNKHQEEIFRHKFSIADATVNHYKATIAARQEELKAALMNSRDTVSQVHSVLQYVLKNSQNDLAEKVQQLCRNLACCTQRKCSGTNMLTDLGREPSGYFENFCRMSTIDFEYLSFSFVCFCFTAGPIIGGRNQYLLSKIGPRIAKRDTNMRRCVPVQEKLAVALRFLAAGDSFRSLSYLFKISQNSVSICRVVYPKRERERERCLEEVCLALTEELKDEIKMPKCCNDWKSIAESYKNKWNFPHCLGCLDGKHVLKQKPANSSSDFIYYDGGYRLSGQSK